MFTFQLALTKKFPAFSVTTFIPEIVDGPVGRIAVTGLHNQYLAGRGSGYFYIFVFTNQHDEMYSSVKAFANFAIIFLFFLFNPASLQAGSQAGSYRGQDSTDQFRFIQLKGYSGLGFYANETPGEGFRSGFGSLDIRYGWQSSNPDKWQSIYRYPAYGVGLFAGVSGHDARLSRPAGVYGFISFPLRVNSGHVLAIEPALGLSYDLKPAESAIRPHNEVRGLRFDAYFNINFGGRYQMNPEIDLLYGVGLTHYSNGRTFRPNNGINILGASIGLRYHFSPDGQTSDKPRFDPEPGFEGYSSTKKAWGRSILVYGAGGFVQNHADRGTNKHYPTASLLLEYMHRFSVKHGTSAGLDLFYDPSLDDDFPEEKHHVYAAHLGYDYHFWQMCFRIQAGTYIHKRGQEMKGSYFLRPAVQYSPANHLFLQLGLKTRAGFNADWIEFGLGFRLPVGISANGPE